MVYYCLPFTWLEWRRRGRMRRRVETNYMHPFHFKLNAYLYSIICFRIYRRLCNGCCDLMKWKKLSMGYMHWQMQWNWIGDSSFISRVHLYNYYMYILLKQGLIHISCRNGIQQYPSLDLLSWSKTKETIVMRGVYLLCLPCPCFF